MNYLKLYIWDEGDPSVGLFSQEWIIDCPFTKDEVDEENLDWFKKQILDSYKEYCQGRCVCMYEFELKYENESITEKEYVINALKSATNNFTKIIGPHKSTLLGWFPNFDEQGRPLNPNPNYQSYSVNIAFDKYYIIQKGWNVKVYLGNVHYMTDKKPYIELDITPDYVKEYYAKQKTNTN